METIEGISKEETIKALTELYENPDEYLCNLLSKKLSLGVQDYSANEFIIYWFNEINPKSELKLRYPEDELTKDSALFFENEVENKRAFIKEILRRICLK